jgi:hypothetical protein
MLGSATIALGLAMVAALGLTEIARASTCDDKLASPDAYVAGLKAATTCDASMKLFRDCSSGASGDVSLGEAVQERCEADFLKNLTASQKRTYERGQQACLSKYAHESGSMYVSFSAFCGAELAQRYSQQALKHKQPPH